jgi:aryl-alcohol dehydrogenase-like predicted oxidoreductase
MKYRSFSNLGWNVSEIGLGCWQIGWCWGEVVSELEARDLLKKALDKGVNFFDTSDTYGDGRSERFLSEIKNMTKEKVYISTKLGRRVRGTNYQKGYKHSPMEEFIDRSLKNLKVECIDLLQLHCPPSDLCSKPETYDFIDEFVKKGKVANYGVSVWNVSDALEAIKFKNVKSIQLVFNIFRQKPIDLFLKEAKKRNIAVIARGPLASGLLTGNIDENTKFPENDHRNYNINGEAFDIGDTFSGVNLKKGFLAIKKLKEIIPKNTSLGEIALKWILQHKEITVVIPGAINKEQVDTNTNVSQIEDISNLMEKINSVYDEFIREDVHHKW